jgi:hypothetical protein
LLSAGAFGASTQSHSKIRIELPPTFRPYDESLWLSRPAYPQNHAGAFASIAYIGLD